MIISKSPSRYRHEFDSDIHFDTDSHVPNHWNFPWLYFDRGSQRSCSWEDEKKNVPPPGFCITWCRRRTLSLFLWEACVYIGNAVQEVWCTIRCGVLLDRLPSMRMVRMLDSGRPDCNYHTQNRATHLYHGERQGEAAKSAKNGLPRITTKSCSPFTSIRLKTFAQTCDQHLKSIPPTTQLKTEQKMVCHTVSFPWFPSHGGLTHECSARRCHHSQMSFHESEFYQLCKQ